MSFQRFDDDDPRECLARLSSARTMQNVFMNNKGWTHNNNNKSRKKLFMPFLHRHPLLRGKNYSRRKLLIFTRHFHSNSVETTQNNFVVCSWSGVGARTTHFSMSTTSGFVVVDVFPSNRRSRFLSLSLFAFCHTITEGKKIFSSLCCVIIKFVCVNKQEKIIWGKISLIDSEIPCKWRKQHAGWRRWES